MVLAERGEILSCRGRGGRQILRGTGRREKAHHKVVVLGDLVLRVVERPPRLRLGLGERLANRLEELADAKAVPSHSVQGKSSLGISLLLHVQFRPTCEVPSPAGDLDEIGRTATAVRSEVSHKGEDDVRKSVLEHARRRVLRHARSAPVVLLIEAKVEDGDELWRDGS